MENIEQTSVTPDENILKSLQENASDLKELANEKFDQMHEKAEDFLEKVTSGEFMDDAKEKMSSLVEEAKGIWTNLTDGETNSNESAIKETDVAESTEEEEEVVDEDETVSNKAE